MDKEVSYEGAGRDGERRTVACASNLLSSSSFCSGEEGQLELDSRCGM